MKEQTIETRTYTSGDTIFEEGDVADAAFIITTGAVTIYKSSNSGGELVLATHKSGEIVGEMGLIDSSPRTATARAMGPTTLDVIPKIAIDKLLSNTDVVMRRIITTLVDRLRLQSEKTVENTF